MPKGTTKDTFIFDNPSLRTMADAMMTYTITAGIFVFLTAILFGARAKRYRSGFSSGVEGGHKETT